MALARMSAAVSRLSSAVRAPTMRRPMTRAGGWFLGWNAFVQLPAFLVYFAAATAEVARTPFDLPEGEAEIVAGYHLEYGGMKWSLFFMAEYFGLTALSGLGVTIFLGGWQAPLPALAFIPSYCWFAAKLLTLLFVFIWIRATFPRLRIDQLTRLAWKFLVPLALINLLTTAFWSLTGGWTGLLAFARWPVAGALGTTQLISANCSLLMWWSILMKCFFAPMRCAAVPTRCHVEMSTAIFPIKNVPVATSDCCKNANPTAMRRLNPRKIDFRLGMDSPLVKKRAISSFILFYLEWLAS